MMRYRRSRATQKGFVLLITAVLLLSLTVIVAAFVSMLVIRTRSAAIGLESAKAFWLAEAGIQQVVYKLRNDSTYRTTPISLSGSLASGTYAVTVTKQTGQTVYSVSSTGMVGAITRTVTQTLTYVSGGWVRQFTNYGAFDGANANITLKHTSVIRGDVYAAKNVQTDAASSVTGTVYAPSGSGNYARLPLPVPPLAMPTFSTTFYDSAIITAKAYPKKDMTYATLNLAGGTVYVDGKVTARNITGPGTIVCVGDFTANGGTIGTDVTIISGGNITTNANSRFGSGTVLFGTNSVQSISSGVVMTNTAILTPGSVHITQANFSGAIYSAGNVVIDSSTSINGAVVTGGSLTMDHTSQIIQNANSLPAKVPAGLESGGSSETSVLMSNWNE